MTFIRKMKNIFSYCSVLLFLLVVAFNCKSPIQNDDFSSVRSGTYFKYRNGNQLHTTIIRKDSIQMEINANTADTTIWKITWLDESTYFCQILGLPKSKSPNEINRYKRSVILVNIKSLTENYYTYQTKLTLDGETGTINDTLWLKKK